MKAKDIKKLIKKNKDNASHHYALVYDEKGTVRVYRDGKPCNITIDYWVKE